MSVLESGGWWLVAGGWWLGSGVSRRRPGVGGRGSGVGVRRPGVGGRGSGRALGVVAALAFAACGGDGGSANGQMVPVAGAPEFPADSAFELLRRQVEFGPRVPGSEGHAAQLAWMTEFLRERADTLLLQPFTHSTAAGETLELTNLFARFRPDDGTRILVLAHWDTRPRADLEGTPEDRATPIPGANDGGSGTAVLLQLADVLARHPPPIGVDILLVDGEDWGPGSQDMYLGAKYFAANRPPGYRPLYGVLVDLVGDRNPVYPIEGNSQQYAPEVVDRVWRMAERLGHGARFPRRSGIPITDDHIPLNHAGIRTINIIDFDYGPGNRYWHTLEDDLDQVAPTGLGVVGEVLVALIWNGG